MSFYFNDVKYSMKDCHTNMDLHEFIERLDDKDFDTNNEIDFRELGALIFLLDIAIDDGRSLNLDLTDETTERNFDDAVEGFSNAIGDIIKSIGNPGGTYSHSGRGSFINRQNLRHAAKIPTAGFISKLEAKEILSLVSRRIGDTVRSRPKPKETVFKTFQQKKPENFDHERKGMSKFIDIVPGT
jgi:hypothetical protein